MLLLWCVYRGGGGYIMYLWGSKYIYYEIKFTTNVVFTYIVISLDFDDL